MGGFSYPLPSGWRTLPCDLKGNAFVHVDPEEASGGYAN
ncbi:hypothetical protein ASAC_0714 [Acidilobus saccharovorans 345-15]|uniref:Uncharacterized protein n=1 Tax=Acidilobus saccharovorans (strain DSM 16705 / JCM 18335 / VKM B-2471 / 345-15) TaxID=666510 RepID=D9Q1D2_ACIS3|nr:hypothetical protein ASAC_0714 [Acidilobus saccharovorans 345-15]